MHCIKQLRVNSPSPILTLIIANATHDQGDKSPSLVVRG